MSISRKLFKIILWGVFISYASNNQAKAVPAEVPIDNVVPFVKSSYETEWAALMNERFCRNLTVPIPEKPVIVQFFLLPDGHIRDVQLEKNSKISTKDLLFADAILCASPLPKPPLIRKVLPAPPSQNFLPSEYYGSGVYRYTFFKNNQKNSVEVNGIRIIPREVLYRYPNLFEPSEIDSKENMIRNPPTDVFSLEDIRLQWANFYDKNPNSTKDAIKKFGRDILIYIKKE